MPRGPEFYRQSITSSGAPEKKSGMERDRHVERRRPAKSDVDPVRLLVLYDLAHKLGRYGQTLSASPFDVAIVAMSGLTRMV